MFTRASRLKLSPPNSARGNRIGSGYRSNAQILEGSAYLIAAEAATAAAATAAVAEEASDNVFVEAVISVPRAPPSPAPVPEPLPSGPRIHFTRSAANEEIGSKDLAGTAGALTMARGA